MYEFWYDYIKLEYRRNSKLCYMETDSFITHIKTPDVYEDITKSNYATKRPLPIEKNKNVIGLMKYELRGKNYDRTL